MELLHWKVFNLLIVDIINYNQIVRNLTEWTTGNPSMCLDQGSITDGVGNVIIDSDSTGTQNLQVAR